MADNPSSPAPHYPPNCQQGFDEWLDRRGPTFRAESSGTMLANMRAAWGEGARFALSETAPSRDAVLAFLRNDLQLDENGDSACGVAPLPGWETGYCAGLRTAYRALKNAAPALHGEGLAPNTPSAAPMPEAALCVVVPLSVMEKVDAAIKFYANMESYLPPRTGGVVQGCPRSGLPPISVDRGKGASDVLMELVKLYPLVRDGERPSEK